jgi:hypothetical protein
LYSFKYFQKKELFYLKFNELKGIDFNTTGNFGSDFNRPIYSNFALNLLNSYHIPFDLYFNGELIKISSNGDRTCDETQLLDIYKSTNTILFSLLYFARIEINGRYPRKWCASAFKNVFMKDLLVIRQPIRFFPENTSSPFDCWIRFMSIESVTIEMLNREILRIRKY